MINRYKDKIAIVDNFSEIDYNIDYLYIQYLIIIRFNKLLLL